jgi:hypothetical protein
MPPTAKLVLQGCSKSAWQGFDQGLKEISSVNQAGGRILQYNQSDNLNAGAGSRHYWDFVGRNGRNNIY